jgi:hypothetical protein
VSVRSKFSASTFAVMANGSKRAKVKKISSPATATPPQEDSAPADTEVLLDDLLAELDSRNPVVQQEAATVISEIQLNSDSVVSPPPNEKKGSKQRFKEREVRHPEFFEVSSESQ